MSKKCRRIADTSATTHVMSSIPPQRQLYDDVTALEGLVKPLLSELSKGQDIEQCNALEFLENAPSMQPNAMEKFTQLKTLINLDLSSGEVHSFV